jgi:hypothetical protein
MAAKTWKAARFRTRSRLAYTELTFLQCHPDAQRCISNVREW